MRRAIRRVAIAAILVPWVVAGSTAQTVVQPPDPSVAPAGAEALIRPGDQVVMQIWREPELSGSFTVDEEGEVVLPRLGVIHATELSAGALQDSLHQVLGRYLRNPSVEISVLRRIGVHGEVRQPDLYMVDLTMTLRDVIARAGGITEAGNPEKVTVVRGGEQIQLGDEERAQFITAELRSGDQVVVGRRSWIAMNPLAVISTGTALVSFFVGVILPLIP